MNIEFIDINKEIETISFTDKNFDSQFNISPFRPEMFGSLIYATVFYICNKYNIELVMHGEANMLPFYSMYSHKCILYNLNNEYRNNKKLFSISREVLIEHLQRRISNFLDSSKINFCSRFYTKPNYDKNKILGMLLEIVGAKINKKPQEIMSSISYNDIKKFIINHIEQSKVYLTSASKKCIEAINVNNNTIWFCSHNKNHFKDFESFIDRETNLVIKNSLWSNNQKIQDIILDIDANSLLSTQILASHKLDIRFIASGGATTLFQTIPYIKTVHLAIWDYYTLDYNDIKTYFLQKSSTNHKLFHIGGYLNNSNKIPFKNKINGIDFLAIPPYAKRLDQYDTNILNYIGHVGECLVNQKHNELKEILSLL